ncbi:2323_t:CDS:2 [Entrophospora sp. SA101]|nr:10760_t:CDS:2 [Entrophospora sp. SA101]CAJ0749818.1 2323_t:CDS:2 [Entrophospora sp. SA101]CAJ0890230.1 10207_t:CDS:2 [Entrophospora sp. SA101]
MTKKQTEQVLNFTQIQALCLPPTSFHLPHRHDKLLETILLMAYLGKGQKQRLVFNLLNNSYISKKAKSNPANDTWKTISRVAVRSFASILHYDLGLDAASIQQLLGHSQFRTTERYLKKDARFLLTNLQRCANCSSLKEIDLRTRQGVFSYLIKKRSCYLTRLQSKISTLQDKVKVVEKEIGKYQEALELEKNNPIKNNK